MSVGDHSAGGAADAESGAEIGIEGGEHVGAAEVVGQFIEHKIASGKNVGHFGLGKLLLVACAHGPRKIFRKFPAPHGLVLIGSSVHIDVVHARDRLGEAFAIVKAADERKGIAHAFGFDFVGVKHGPNFFAGSFHGDDLLALKGHACFGIDGAPVGKIARDFFSTANQ